MVVIPRQRLIIESIVLMALLAHISVAFLLYRFRDGDEYAINLALQ